MKKDRETMKRLREKSKERKRKNYRER